MLKVNLKIRSQAYAGTGEREGPAPSAHRPACHLPYSRRAAAPGRSRSLGGPQARRPRVGPLPLALGPYMSPLGKLGSSIRPAYRGGEGVTFFPLFGRTDYNMNFFSPISLLTARGSYDLGPKRLSSSMAELLFCKQRVIGSTPI